MIYSACVNYFVYICNVKLTDKRKPLLINIILTILFLYNLKPEILKKKNVLSAKQDNLIVAVNSGVGVLEKNANQSLNCYTIGHELIDRINKEGGMTETLAAEAENYVTQCRAAIAVMNSDRKPFTQRLTEIQKQFVSYENSIDPSKNDTPAYELLEMRKAWLMKLKREAELEEQRLQANYQRTEKRIAAREDLDDAQKQAALKRAESRLMSGRVALKMSEIATEKAPIVTKPEGYIDLLRYWWHEIGCNLPDSDLERIFRPMLSYAKKQARKGIIVESEYVVYQDVPKGTLVA